MFLNNIINTHESRFTLVMQMKNKTNVNTNNVLKKSYIDYYTSKEINEISIKCIKSLLDLYTFLLNIDNSHFDDWDNHELKTDKIRISQMITEIINNFGDGIEIYCNKLKELYSKIGIDIPERSNIE